MDNLFSTQCNTLSVFVNSKCNLNCDYCYLHKNEIYDLYNDKITAAWKDGTYIKNIDAVLNRLGVPNANITRLEYWGGEPLLQPDIIRESLSEFYQKYPRLSFVFISTNGMINIKSLLEILKTIDENARENTTFFLQVSLDGPDGIITEHGHNSSKQVLENNYIKLVEFCKCYAFHNINKIKISIKAYMKKDLFLEYFSEDKNIIQYIDYMADIYSFIMEGTKIAPIIIPQIHLPNIASLYTATKEDGYKLAAIARKWESIGQQYSDLDYPDRKLPIYYGFGFFWKNFYYTAPRLLCSQQIVQLCIMYNGNIANCSSTYLLYQPELLEYFKQKGDLEEAKACQIYQDNIFNPLELSDEELQDKIYAIYSEKYNGHLNSYNRYKLLQYLALIGEVPYELYGDPDRTLLYSQLLGNAQGCSKLTLQKNGNSFLPLSDPLILYCNGLIQKFYEDNENISRTEIGDIYGY